MTLWSGLQQKQVTPENRRGKGQGYFRYYRPDGTFKAIVAVNGRLISDGGDLPITGLPDGFQKDRSIEAVQWKDRLFIATGTDLVEYDGTVAKVVEAYKPKPLEALYIGTNGLADFPDNYLEDGEGLLAINGVIPSLRYGVTNQPTTFSTFITKDPAEVVEYKYEYGKKEWATNTGVENLLLGKDWSPSKTWDFTPKESGNWTIKVSMRVAATPEKPNPLAPETFTIPTYKVTDSNENKAIDTDWVGTCNRIMLYWDRLIVYGDTENKTQIYLSHLGNPRYFPVNNTLDFENPEQEAISKIISYRDMLIVFMPSSIQGVHGKAPTGDDPFTRHVIHSGIGCIAPETAKVMGNIVVFLSKEGVHLLKSFAFNENRMNIEKLDSSVEKDIPLDENACAIVFDGQYHITFPNIKKRFRYYRDYGTWTTDESPYFDFVRMYEWKSELVVQSLNTGEVYQFDETVYNDLGYVYEDRVVTKSYDLGMPYNPKKFKELQVITERNTHDIRLAVTVNIDDNPMVNPEVSTVEVVDGEIKVSTEFTPNIVVDSGTVLGSWDLGVSSFDKAQTAKSSISFSGKGRTASIDIRHREDGPSVLLGLALIFKVKKA